MGGGTESLTRQDRLLCVLVEKFQPVWREIEEAGVFRRRGLVSREDLLVPQHVMIGLVMLRGLLTEAGHDVLSWADLIARRDADPDVARQFKRWMNALTEYFNGVRPLSSIDLAHLGARSDDDAPRPSALQTPWPARCWPTPVPSRRLCSAAADRLVSMQFCGHRRHCGGHLSPICRHYGQWLPRRESSSR